MSKEQIIAGLYRQLATIYGKLADLCEPKESTDDPAQPSLFDLVTADPEKAVEVLNGEPTKPARSHKRYTPDEEATLKFLFESGKSDEEIGRMIHRTPHSIQTHRSEKGLVLYKKGGKA